MALILAGVVLVIGMGVSAQAQTGTLGVASTPTSGASVPAAPVKTHTNADFAGATVAPFSVACVACHVAHGAANAKLLQADGAAVCATCHDVNAIHQSSAAQQALAISSTPSDCVSCHAHSSGFMPALGAEPLTLTKQMVGYDDLDGDGQLSPGDRVHYRIDYANPGTLDVTGVALRDTPDAAHVASVEAITGGGTFDGTAIQWSIGTLAAEAGGSVTYDVVLRDALSFDTGPTAPATPTTITVPTTTTLAPDSPTTTSTTTADSTTTTADSTTTTADSTTLDTGSTTSTTAGAPTTDSTTAPAPSDTSTTTSTATPLVPATDLVNTAMLSADNRIPVSASCTVSVVVAGPLSTASSTTSTAETTSSTAPVSDTTTTTAPATGIASAIAMASGTATPNGSTTPATDTSTSAAVSTTTVAAAPSTATTSVPQFIDVFNAVVLSATNGIPVSTLGMVSVMAPTSPAATPSTTPTTETTTTAAAPTTTTAPAAGEASVTSSTTSTTDSLIPASTPVSLTLSEQVVGYDDLDGNGHLSPGDRLHYRIDYRNPGPVDVTGVVLRDGLDAAHVASVETISDAGALDATASVVQWDLGTLAVGASGFVTFDAVLQGPVAFGGAASPNPTQVVRGPAFTLVTLLGGWVFPVQGPNHFSDDFGAPRYSGGYHTHKGIDILCARGTPLVAVVNGVISGTTPTDVGLGGITIHLRGDDGNVYYYAHLTSIAKGIARGVRVKAGQVIGFSGNTGDAAGGPVHLHFEIHPGGGPAVDPYLVLKGALLVSQVPLTTPGSVTSTTTTTTIVPPTTTTTTTTGGSTSTTTTAPPDSTTIGTDSTTTTATDVSTTDTTTAPPTTAPVTTDTTAAPPTTAPVTTDTTAAPPTT